MTSKINYFMLMASLSLVFQSCKKDKENPVELPQQHQFQINFTNSSVNINQTDSVVLTLKKPGSVDLVRKLTKGDDMYYTDGAPLNNLEWSAAIDVYMTKAAGVQASHVYSINRAVTKQLTLAAPTGKLTDLWNPRLLITSAAEKVQFMVAERPDDPFFAIKAANHADWNYAYLERGTETPTGQVETVKAWEAYNELSERLIFPNNKDNYDHTYFLDYSNSMMGKPYTKAYALLMLFNKHSSTRDITIYHVYDKRP